MHKNWFLLLAAALLVACTPAVSTSTPEAVAATPVPMLTNTPTPEPTATATPTPIPTITSTITPTLTPIGGGELALIYINIPQMRPGAWAPVQTASVNLYRPQTGELRQLVELNSSGESIRRVVEEGWMPFNAVSIAPDGGSAVYSFTSTEALEVTRVNLETGQTEVLLSLPKNTSVELLEWSPDGQWIAVRHVPHNINSLMQAQMTFIALGGQRTFSYSCYHLRAWDVEAGLVYCQTIQTDYFHQVNLSTQDAKIYTWPSQIFRLTQQNYSGRLILPEIDGMVAYGEADAELHYFSNLSMLLKEPRSNADVKAFTDTRVPAAEASGNEPNFLEAILSPDGSRILLNGLTGHSTGPVTKLDERAFSHIYEIGGAPLDLTGAALVNHLWGIRWSPDGKNILALKDASTLRNNPHIPGRLFTDLVILDAETLEEVWSMGATDPNHRTLLENIYQDGYWIANFDVVWR